MFDDLNKFASASDKVQRVVRFNDIDAIDIIMCSTFRTIIKAP